MSGNANSAANAIDFDALRRAAEHVLQHAYAPYSGFSVAAALIDDQGRIFTGVNVENASYGLTVCAERNAIATAVGAGARALRGIAVICSGQAVPMPCGACRQVICELSPDCTVRCYGADGSEHTYEADALLPARFRFTR
jgi:cytidine deaminase